MNHGIVLGGYYSTHDTFMSRSPGSYRIATFCKSIGWEVEVIDYISHFPKNILINLIKNIIKKKNSKWIGISYNWLTEYNTEIRSLFAELKREFPHLKMIVGGQSPYRENLNADWYVFGYGEEALEAILKFEFDSGPMPVSEPIEFPEDAQEEKITHGTMKGEISIWTPNLLSIYYKPNARFINAVRDYKSITSKIYNIEYSENDFLNSNDVVSLELSRGCKFKCSYCNYPFIGLKDDTSTEEEILYRELNENYQKWGIKQYMIADDTYNDRIEKISKLRNVVKRLDFEPNFFSFIRADLLATNPDMIEILAESRVWGHYYGIETFNKMAGLAVGKGMDPNRIKDTLLKVKEYMLSNINAYRGTIGLIAGLPYESLESCEETEAWTRKHWNDQSRIWWPLQIGRDKNNLSAFGKNLSAFGYREIKTDQTVSYIHKNSINDILWENDLTNVIEVDQWVNQFRSFQQPVDSMSIPGYVGLFGIDYALKKLSNMRVRFAEPDYKSAATKHITDYITKKILAWV